MAYDETFSYDYNIHITPGGGDDSLLVKFYIDAVEDAPASRLAGRPIFKDVEWVEIRQQGPRGDGVARPARPADFQRFPKHYAAFKNRIAGDAEAVVGTPLSTWPWHGMTRARVEELKFFKVRTVEQVAAMPDNVGQQIMGFQQMKQAAQQYLESVKVSAPLARLQAQLEQAMGVLAEQGLEIARLRARAQNLPEPAAADVMVPMREQIQRELATIDYTPPAPAESTVVELAKKRKVPPSKGTPGRRRPGY